MPHVFTSKEVTWANVPVAALAGKFAATSFDLLLCAYTTPQPTLEYMAATSKARWRVGTYRAGKEHCYDMMINLEKTTDVKYFWNQAKHFLNNIEYA